MNELNYFKAFKIWIISLAIYNILLFTYLIIGGRIIGELYGSNIVTILSMAIAFSSVVIGLTTIIYSVMKKNTQYIFVGIGTLALTMLLYLWIIVLALSTIY
jgi:hypothetical protein